MCLKAIINRKKQEIQAVQKKPIKIFLIQAIFKKQIDFI